MSGPNPNVSESVSVGREKRRLLVIDIAALLDSTVESDSTAKAEAIVALITEKYRLETRRCWTAKERETRKAHRKKYGPEEVARLCERNDLTIPQARNRRQQWTSQELEVACRWNLSDEEVARQLGRTIFGVNSKRKQLRSGFGEPTQGKVRRWTGPELELIARPDLTAVEVARMIGRTPNAVTIQRGRMGIDPRKSNLAGVRQARIDQARQ